MQDWCKIDARFKSEHEYKNKKKVTKFILTSKNNQKYIF